VADNFVTNPASGGATFAADDIGGVLHQRAKIQHGVDGSASDVSVASGLPITEALESPQVSYDSASSLAAGSSTDLDSAQITTDKTGKLLLFSFGSSAPLKAELQTVSNAAGTTLMVLYSQPGEDRIVRFPSKEFITQAYSATVGLDGFRLRVTNLDVAAEADVHASFLFDETA
jgi:hypothetical protein